MKTIQVVASIIHQDGKILATQRGYGEQGLVGISRWKDGTGRNRRAGHRARNSRGAECGDRGGEEGLHGGV